MFKTNDYLEEIIANKNVVRIRSAFTVIAHEDPSFSTGKFNETLAYVKSKNIEGLFTPYDGRPFQQENWNEDYWALVVSSLMDNFCEERIAHLKAVSAKLYPRKIASQSSQRYTQTRTQGSGMPQKKAVPIVITAGLAVTCFVGVAVGAKGVATATGVMAIATGIYTIFKE